MFKYIESDEHYSEVVAGLMSGARERLDIATANIKAIRVLMGKRPIDILAFFRKRLADGVQIRVLHSAVPSEYLLRIAGKNPMPEGFTMRRCPRVHQKTILADDRLLYIGSANLTGAGIGAKSSTRRNFEVGVLTDERDFIDKASSLFEMIWCGDMCFDCARKDFCPVPLEEF
ncbi:MAG TPA: phospholipase [candidate division Zixibacteria bacterium]|nr:phospholipase [candidate division Zixibacteria bacterium]